MFTLEQKLKVLTKEPFYSHLHRDTVKVTKEKSLIISDEVLIK